MAAVDQSLVEVVESLPQGHRRHLEAKFIAAMPRRVNRRARAELVAARIGPRNIQQYDRLYLSGNGLSFVWIYVPDVRTSLSGIAAQLRKKHGERLTDRGLEPNLEPEDSPKLHRMLERTGRIELEFGLRENDRMVFRGWSYRVVESDHIYRVVIKDAPFTVEIRAPFPKVQEALLAALAEEISEVDFSKAQHCGLSTEALRDKLEKELPSELFGKWDVGTGQGLGSSRMYSDDETPLRSQQDFIEQSKHEHRELTHLDYRFSVVHAFDGYVEEAEYGVNLRTGDMRVGPRTSEIALEHLRKNVVRIVAAP